MTCAEADLPRVRAWLRLHPAGFADAYPLRLVNNVYLDTPDLTSLADHLDGAHERSKLRFRWYGSGKTAVRGSLELKCKSGQV